MIRRDNTGEKIRSSELKRKRFKDKEKEGQESGNPAYEGNARYEISTELVVGKT